MLPGLAVGAAATAATVATFLVVSMAAVEGTNEDETDAVAGPASCGNDPGRSGTGVSLRGIKGGFDKWNAQQVSNARVIAQVGMQSGVGAWGVTIALATAMQESTLNNLNGGHLDSQGLFQQRPSQGWGTQQQITTPTFAALSFYGVNPAVPNRGLTDVKGWKSLPLTEAAQRVQGSGFPGAYARWEPDARRLTDFVLKGAKPGGQPITVAAPVNCSTGPQQPVSADGFVNPLKPASYRMVSPFGRRFHPIKHVWKLHDGQDMAAPTGTPIHAACSGKVVFAGVLGSGGNTTTVDCGGSIQTRYMHQSAFKTKVGAQVKAGSVIGLVGSTGGSTGPHLHFTVLTGAKRPNGGTAVDPVPFMKKHGASL